MAFNETFQVKILALRSTEGQYLSFAFGNFDPDSWMIISQLPLTDPCKKATRIGRPPHYLRYRDLVSIVEEEVLTVSDVAAQEKRQDCTAYGGGILARELRATVMRRIPETKNKISESTIRRFMLPPNNGRKAAKYYHGLVNAKAIHRRNDDVARVHVDAQYAAAQVSNLLEFAFGFCENETFVLSCDNKNQIDVGIPAVHQLVRPQGYSMVDKNPNMPDHTFPGGEKCKLVPAGYMFLERHRNRRPRSESPKKPFSLASFRRSRSASPDRRIVTRRGCTTSYPTFDRLHRERVKYPRAGTLHLFVFPKYFYKSTSTRHCINLQLLLKERLLQSGKSVVILVTDGGPDWCSNSLLNILNFGQLWSDLDLDALILVRYAPGQSKYNMIERRWGPLTKRMSQVILRLCLPGENQSVFHQPISKQEKDTKIRKVFNNAIDNLFSRWSGDRYSQFGIELYPIYSPISGECANDVAHGERHQKLNNITRGSKDHDFDNLRFVLRHCSRSSYKLEITKCGDQRCKCMKNGIRATNFFQFLNAHGGCSPTPSLAESRPGRPRKQSHYRTMIEMLRVPPKPQQLKLDSCAPSKSGENGTDVRCDKGCRYIFFSIADKTRHNTLMHPNKHTDC